VADIARLGIEIDSKGVVQADGRLKKLNKTSAKSETATDKLKKSWSSFSKLLIAGGVAVGLRALINAVDVGQRSFLQLRVGLESTEHASGQTLESMVALSEEMQRTTKFADDVVQSAEAILLSFTNIADDAFPRTVRAAADVATRMGTDLRGAIVQLAKALNDPVQNLGALNRAGIQFSKDQKLVIKQMVETNRIADAQNVILTELEKQYGGSARAARETLGGAVTNLKNSFSDFGEAAGRFIGPPIRQAAKAAAAILDFLTSKINAAADGIARLSGTYETTLKGMAEAGTAALDAISQTTGRSQEEILELVAANKKLALATEVMHDRTIKLSEAQKKSVETVRKILDQLGEHAALLGKSAEEEARYRVALAGGNQALQDRAAEWARTAEAKAARLEVEEMTRVLREESLALRLSADQVILRTARMKGASAAQLAQIQTIQQTIAAQREKMAVDSQADQLLASLKTREESINEQRELAFQLFKRGTLSVTEYGQAIGRLNERMFELQDSTTSTTDTITTQLPTWGSEMQNLALTFGTSFIDTLFDAERRAELTFESVASGFAKMVARMLAQQALLAALGMPSMFGPGRNAAPAAAAAKGAVFNAGRVTPMARGGVVTQPTLFPMQRGAGLMGEAGPEAVMPLTRTSTGELGVKAQGAAQEIVVNIINNTGAAVTHQRRQSGQRTELDIMIGNAVDQQIKEGRFDRSMSKTFGMQRRAGR
jgi:hypothetical protein